MATHMMPWLIMQMNTKMIRKVMRKISTTMITNMGMMRDKAIMTKMENIMIMIIPRLNLRVIK